MARSTSTRRASLTLTIAALGTAVVLAIIGLVSTPVSTVDTGAGFVVAFVFWIGSAVLALPVTVAAVLGIVFGARSGTNTAVVLGSLALVAVAAGVIWFFSV